MDRRNADTGDSGSAGKRGAPEEGKPGDGQSPTETMFWLVTLVAFVMLASAVECCVFGYGCEALGR